MKEGIKFGIGCFIGMTLGALGLAMLDDILKKVPGNNNEKGGEEES